MREFKTDFEGFKDLFEYLLIDGNKVYTIGNGFIFGFLDGSLYDFKASDQLETGFCFAHWENCKKYIEPKWYENIPKHGVLCWCGNSENNLSAISIITGKGYNNGFYSKSNAHYCYATPLTNEEIKQFTSRLK